MVVYAKRAQGPEFLLFDPKVERTLLGIMKVKRNIAQAMADEETTNKGPSEIFTKLHASIYSKFNDTKINYA